MSNYKYDSIQSNNNKEVSNVALYMLRDFSRESELDDKIKNHEIFIDFDLSKVEKRLGILV